MRAFLINPYDETITEVEGPFNDLDAMYEALSEPGRHKVDTATTIRVSSAGDVLYLDDEGHLNAGRVCWALAGYPTPLAGRALLLGTDARGYCKAPSTRLSLAVLLHNVTWLHMESTGEFGATTTDIVNTPIGPVTRISTGAPRVKYPEEK